MRYRQLTPSGDYSFGSGQANFYTNIPEAPAQAVLTRLRLNLGEWFLDTTDGTPWNTQVLGNNTAGTRDAVIQARILGTQGVNSIISYSSNFNSNTRQFFVYVSLDTIYGPIPTSSSTGSSSTAALIFALDNSLLGILGGPGELG